MSISPNKINLFLGLKLPAAFICGVRVKSLESAACQVTVKHRWINQNPFNSIFWAVQGMAAELSTGALVMSKIKDRGVSISMLVISNNASFSKKATGRITFICEDGQKVEDAIDHAMASNQGQTLWMNSIGRDEEGVKVSNFNFEWTIKLRGEK